MRSVKIALLFLLGIFAVTASALGQSEQVVIYNDYNFQGANIPLNGSWDGGGVFDRNIKSIRVPSGYRVTLYTQRNYRGTQTVITDDWNPGAGAWWTTRIRSIRITGAPVQPPSSGNFPVIYAQANYRGPAMAVERDWSGSRDWDGSPHRIRSIRVPDGWKLTLYEQPNFRGTQTVIRSNISWTPTAYWNGRTRSIRVSRDDESDDTPSPSGFPVIYARPNLQGPAMAVERDFAGNADWSGSPHQIRSIRVPSGWFLVLYDRRNFRGKSYNLDSDWTPMPGDYWYGRIRSIKVYKGAPPKQPR